MTDKEMLERAAMAAGYFVVRVADDGSGLLLEGVQDAWNPLNDDGDALRLAVNLEIDVNFYGDYVVGWPDGRRESSGKIMYEGDPYAATRRAITRAAAEMSAK